MQRRSFFYKQDLHTHSSLCGGKHTHERMVREAMQRGMPSIGFSEHSRVSFAPGHGMSEADEIAYRGEILHLREKYGDRIRIFRGIEQDFYSDLPPLGYDYVIGSVHYLRVDGVYCPITGSCEEIRATVKNYFCGDVFSFLRLYFQTVSELPRRTACQVIGHLDAIADANFSGALFDEKDHFYLGYAMKAIDALLEQDMIFEVNTRPFSDPRRRMFNPSFQLLRHIAGRGGRITLGSDATSSEELARGFDVIAPFCKGLGFSSVAVLTENGWGRAAL